MDELTELAKEAKHAQCAIEAFEALIAYYELRTQMLWTFDDWWATIQLKSLRDTELQYLSDNLLETK